MVNKTKLQHTRFVHGGVKQLGSQFADDCEERSFEDLLFNCKYACIIRPIHFLFLLSLSLKILPSFWKS